MSDIRGTVTADDLAEIGAAIGAAPRMTDDRPPLAGLLMTAGLDRLPCDAPWQPSARPWFDCARRYRPTRTRSRAPNSALPSEPSTSTSRPRWWMPALAAPPRRGTEPATAGVTPKAAPSGTAVLLTDPDPWPAPVDGAALLTETAATVRRYVVVTDVQAIAIALWCAMTYAMDALAIAPILAITSAMMRSGKTTLCMVVGALTPRAILLSSVSAAVVYRLIEAQRPTLIGDEADTWLTDERAELRGVLNAGT